MRAASCDIVARVGAVEKKLGRDWLPLVCGAVTAFSASTVLVGWAFDIRVLKSLVPTYITMKANTALGFLLLAISLIALSLGRRMIARVLASVVATLAIVTLLEYLLGSNAGIDELLVRDPDGASGLFPPGRLAPITAVGFLLLVTALWLSLTAGETAARLSQTSALVALVIAFQAMLGYAFGVTYSFGVAFYTQMALHTAALFVVTGVGVLSLRAHEGLVMIFRAPTMGGLAGRRLLLTAITVPPAVNALLLFAQHAGLFDADFAVLGRVLGNMVFFALMVWRTVTALHRSELSRLQSEEALRTLNAELEQRVAARTNELLRANQELESFSSSVSHDLRAPLRTIDGFSAALEEDAAKDLDAASKQHITRIRAAARRMGALIEGLLDLARLGKQALQVEAIDVTAMARETVEELKRQTPGRAVEFTIFEGLKATADPTLLGVVLENLLRNAWKFTGRAATARIEVGRSDDGAFFVKDNGAGFDMQYAKRLFDVFQRFHKEDEFPGTGVGLATVQRIVSRHGGTVWARSAPGEGATFYFTLHEGARS